MSMTDEDVYINYFEGLAKTNPDIKHQVQNRNSFFCIENPFDFDEIDEAVKNTLAMPCLLLDLPEGNISENQSTNRTEKISGAFMILLRGNTIAERRNARKEAKRIGKDIVAKMKQDSRVSLSAPKSWTLDRENVPYQTVGPIAESYYGMIFSFKMDCPF